MKRDLLSPGSSSRFWLRVLNGNEGKLQPSGAATDWKCKARSRVLGGVESEPLCENAQVRGRQTRHAEE